MHKNKVRAQLVARGSSLRKWALANGYEPRTVAQTVSRWAGADRLPRGIKAFRILEKLSKELGEEVTKGVLA
jgi:hypothetical protein